MKILTFGELLLRLASKGYTKLFQNECLEATFCGGEANVAVSLSVLGLESEFITVLPDNDIGHAAINSMRYFGVKTDKVLYGNGRMGVYFLEKGASQRPSKIIYDREYSAISLARRSDFDWERIFQDVDWFHWTGINPALSEEMSYIIEDACTVAKKMGIVISCDLNYRKKLWSSEKAQFVMPKLLKYVDVCIANEEDAEKTLGLKICDSNVEAGKINKEGYVDIAKKIHDSYGCKYIATTLRESYSASINGWSAMLYDAIHDMCEFSKKYEIQLVDRVGGGDSFAAGLIYGLLMGMDTHEIIEFATAASCLKQTIEGDYNRSTLEEIKNLINNGGSGRVQR